MSTLPTNSVCLVPTRDDIQDRMFHFRYSCSQDMYEHISSASTRRNTGWKNLAYGQPRLQKFEERECVYLARFPEQETASIAWKIDMEGTGVHGKKLEFRAVSSVTGPAKVTWKIMGNGQTHTIDGTDTQTSYEVDVQGHSSVTIIAEVTGGTWQDAQLFRQPVVEAEMSYPFEVMLHMESVQSMVYHLTTLEQKLQLFHLRYFCDTDVYHRKSSGSYIQGLTAGTCHSEGHVREVDEGHVFWARRADVDKAVYTWKIDLSDTPLCVEKMSIMAKCKRYGTGNIVWKISADDKSIRHPGEYLYTARYINMKRSRLVTLEVTLKGGSGGAPWKQTQLFHQIHGGKEHVFDCKLFLAEADME